MTTETTSDNTFVYQGPLSARMACHMGNYRPTAISNVLGDQPLFYIDYVDQEEAEFIDPLMIADGDIPAEYYTENLEDLRRRMDRLESASHHIDSYGREDIETAFDMAAQSQKTDETYLTQGVLIAALSQSRMVSLLYSEMAAKGLSLNLNRQVDTAFYDREQMSVHVNSRLGQSMAVLAAAKALRQAWLHLNGTGIHPLHFAPEEAVLLNRIHQADLAVTTIRAAWEMNLSGEKSAWSRILTVSAYDLAVGFAREAVADFRALNNGSAGHAAFERWFFSGRCKEVDRKLIQQMLADHHGLIFDNPQMSKMVTNEIIARTGETPAGRNYLSGVTETILTDPLFTEVRDRSNANFLWFIKFERSFRSSEECLGQSFQETQKHQHMEGKGKQEKIHEPAVIAFTGKCQKRKASKKYADGAPEATIYYLDHFLALSSR